MHEFWTIPTAKMTFTSSQNIGTWWLMNMEYEHMKVWLLCCCFVVVIGCFCLHICTSFMISRHVVFFPYILTCQFIFGHAYHQYFDIDIQSKIVQWIYIIPSTTCWNYFSISIKTQQHFCENLRISSKLKCFKKCLYMHIPLFRPHHMLPICRVISLFDSTL